jgi:hypothetical protein
MRLTFSLKFDGIPPLWVRTRAHRECETERGTDRSVKIIQLRDL